MLIAVALINLFGIVVVCAAFAYVAKVRAKELTFLVNTALSHNSYEFAQRQQFTEPSVSAVDGEVEYPEHPVGL